MGDYQIRLGSVLTFDEDKEADIIESMEKLSRSHKLGALVSHLLRLAFESPEELSKEGEQLKNLLSKMDQLGVTPTRYTFMSQLLKEVKEMQKKIDDVYNISYKTYTLAQMNKYLGLEEKADNSLMASFILEKQLTDLCMKMGVESLSGPFVSGKLTSAHDRAQEDIEFIIESYDGIIKEFQSKINTQSSVRKEESLIDSFDSFEGIENDDAEDIFIDLPTRQSVSKKKDKVEKDNQEDNKVDTEKELEDNRIVVSDTNKAIILSLLD